MKKFIVASLLALLLATVSLTNVVAQAVADVPRNQTLILGWSITSPIGTTNPWAIPGYTHQEGNALMWEPLMYFGIFAEHEIT
mgnify:CR=1 FL=1